MAEPTANLDSSGQSDDPVAGPVLYIGLLLGLALAITLFALAALTYAYSDADAAKKQSDAQGVDQKLNDNAKAQQIALLAGPVWVDQDQNIVRVPVERAMGLVLDDWHNGRKAIHWLPPAEVVVDNPPAAEPADAAENR